MIGISTYFAHPSIVLARFLSSSPFLDVSQIHGYSKQALLPPPHYGTCLLFFVRRLQPVLPSSTRMELRPPTLLGALDSGFLFIFYFCKYTQKSDLCGIRTPEPTRLIVAFEGTCH